jgi:hypothetical protein
MEKTHYFSHRFLRPPHCWSQVVRILILSKWRQSKVLAIEEKYPDPSTTPVWQDSKRKAMHGLIKTLRTQQLQWARFRRSIGLAPQAMRTSSLAPLVVKTLAVAVAVARDKARHNKHMILNHVK